MTAEQPERDPQPAPEGEATPEPETPTVEETSTESATAESATEAVEPTPVEPAEPSVWRPPEVPQPEPWHPKPKDLDPSSDTGWEIAAKHELRAVRPEDVATLVETDPEFAAAYARATADPVIPSSDAATNLIALPQAPADTALAPSDRRWRRAGRRVKKGLEATARPFLMLSLFGLGVAMGWRTFVGTIPAPSAAPPAAVAAQAEGTTTDVPPQVQSLIAALQSDDQTKVQTVVPSDPYRYLAGEFANWGFKSIRGAQALWTYAKGSDSATEILIAGTTSDGSGITINLVVHLHDGAITEFR
jgi:hypothetical protein